jgi:23S rRNA (adenine2503-C2)-methyltransferase
LTRAPSRLAVLLLCVLSLQVNLICFNPFAGTRFKASPMDQVLAFRSELIQAGRVCTIRDSRGDDEMAACGQLGNPLASAKSAPILEPPERFKSVLAAV